MPHLPSPKKIRWGILGPGRIARQFVRDLLLLEDAELAAVGSRNLASAEVFAQEFGAGRAYGSYEELVTDRGVDVVYVATPHPMHREHTLLALRSGKAVLCEKPLALNASEAREVIGEAWQRGLFLMEAMWTRFFPALIAFHDQLKAGCIGEPRLLVADFGFRAVFDPAGRHFDPALAGGALLDVGIYPLSLAFLVFGRPTQVTSLANLGQTGVDEQSAMLLGFPEGGLAVLYSAIRTETAQSATLFGSEGSLHLPAPWWHPARLVLRPSGTPESPLGQVRDFPYRGGGYQFEAAEVMSCLRNGQTESLRMRLTESIAIMETMDRIRAQWGLRYPSES